MASFQINYLAVLLAALASVIIGALWYSSALFANVWMRATGKTREEVRAGDLPVKIVCAFLAAVIMALVLSVVIGWAQGNTVFKGGLIGLFTGVGFVSTTAYMKDTFEGRPRSLFWVTNMHDLLSLVVMGAILGGWR